MVQPLPLVPCHPHTATLCLPRRFWHLLRLHSAEIRISTSFAWKTIFQTCFANPKWIEGMHRHLLKIGRNFRALLFSCQTLLWLAPQDHPKRLFSLHIPRVMYCQVFNLRGIHKKLLTFPFCHYFNHFCTFLYYRVLLQQLLFTTFLVKLPSWASASTHCPCQVVVASLPG